MALFVFSLFRQIPRADDASFAEIAGIVLAPGAWPCEEVAGRAVMACFSPSALPGWWGPDPTLQKTLWDLYSCAGFGAGRPGKGKCWVAPATAARDGQPRLPAIQFLGTKKSKHVCIHLYSQGALGNSLYPTTAFPKAGVCCWMAWGQCCSQGVQPRDCRRAAGGLCLTTLLPIQQLLPCPNQCHVATEISPQESGCFLRH